MDSLPREPSISTLPPVAELLAAVRPHLARDVAPRMSASSGVILRLLPEQLIALVKHPPFLVAQVASGLPGPDRARQRSGEGIAAEGANLWFLSSSISYWKVYEELVQDISPKKADKMPSDRPNFIQ